MTDATMIECGNCGEPSPGDATWCEACGHELGVEPKPACVSCGEREVDVDEGYCLSCGYRQPRERDHLVVGDGPVVAISDRGRRHHHNEDAVAVGRVPSPGGDRSETLVLVVCDGVSSTPGSARASAAAAGAARDHLIDGLTPRGDPQAGGARQVSVADLLVEAVAAAQAGASASPEPDVVPSPDGPPSSTLVAVVVRPVAPVSTDGAAGPAPRVELTAAWVGDSRAYWVDDERATHLTGPDHEFEGSLTRWLGADSIDPTPDVATAITTGPGHLVVCTDGLWRYASGAEELAALVARLLSEGRTGTSLAEAMVDHANEQGGHDNITVALWSDQPDWPTDTSTHPSIASAATPDHER